MTALVWLFVKANWKLIALVAVLTMLASWHHIQINKAWHAGRAALQVEQAVEAQRRNTNANAANDAAAKCARNPACLLQDDGNRRD